MHVIFLIFLGDVYNDPSTRSSLFLTVERLISIAKVDIRYQICSIQVALIFWQYILSISLKQSYLDFLRAVINFAVVNIFNKSHYQAVYSTPLPLFWTKKKKFIRACFVLADLYTKCKYGRPLGRRPERAAWKRGWSGFDFLFWQCFPRKFLLRRRCGLFYFAVHTGCCVYECHEKGQKSSSVRL